jgi:hypothetical protein
MNILYLVIHLFVDEFCLLLFEVCMFFFSGNNKPIRIRENKSIILIQIYKKTK